MEFDDFKKEVEAMEHPQISIPSHVSIEWIEWYFEYCNKKFEISEPRLQWQNELLEKLSNYPKDMIVNEALGVESIL